jgi:hypothetical protein
VRALGLALAVSLGASPAAADVSVRWLGIAGFTLTSGETTIAEDPFLSRPGILDTLFRLYVPDEAVLSRFLGPDSPAPELARAKLYLVGHSHYDHLGDVPWLASRTQGRVVGSATTSAIARGYGLAPDEAIIVGPGAALEEGPFEVRVFASQHAKVLLGRVPFEGELTDPPETPPRVPPLKEPPPIRAPPPELPPPIRAPPPALPPPPREPPPRCAIARVGRRTKPATRTNRKIFILSPYLENTSPRFWTQLGCTGLQKLVLNVAGGRGFADLSPCVSDRR